MESETKYIPKEKNNGIDKMNEIEMNEIVKQIFNGKKVSQKNYEELVHETSMILINKYNIIFDNNNLLPLDFNMADRVYLAALDLVETTGFFCNRN